MDSPLAFTRQTGLYKNKKGKDRRDVSFVELAGQLGLSRLYFTMNVLVCSLPCRNNYVTNHIPIQLSYKLDCPFNNPSLRFSVDATRYVAEHSRANIMVVEDEEQLAKAKYPHWTLVSLRPFQLKNIQTLMGKRFLHMI